MIKMQTSLSLADRYLFHCLIFGDNGSLSCVYEYVTMAIEYSKSDTRQPLSNNLFNGKRDSQRAANFNNNNNNNNNNYNFL